jgi:hypothetical protein
MGESLELALTGRNKGTMSRSGAIVIEDSATNCENPKLAGLFGEQSQESGYREKTWSVPQKPSNFDANGAVITSAAIARSMTILPYFMALPPY